MKSKITTKSGNSIAKNNYTGKKKKKAESSIVSVPKYLSVTLPTLDVKNNSGEKKGLFPENILPVENTDFHTQYCPLFYNQITGKQRKYYKKIIQNRMQREGIEFKYLVYSLAELFDYDTLKAGWAASSLRSLLTALYKDYSILQSLHSHDRTRALETLEKVSQFLTELKSNDTYGVLFDFAKIEDKTGLQFREVVEMQSKHCEKRIVDDGVFAFDLAFETPFDKLSEDAKVERLKIYLQHHTSYTDSPYILPEKVKQYLPKALESLD